MKYQINEIKLNIGEKESNLIEKISKKLKINKNLIKNLQIIKKSIDSRRKNDVHFKYNLTFDCIEKIDEKFAREIQEVPALTFSKIIKKYKNPIIVGTGPSGLFAGLVFAKMGLGPILIEQGKCASARAKDVEIFWKSGKLNETSNVQFGFGGAGTFSDGKVNSGISSPYSKFVLETFVKYGAPREILYSNSPHIGTDKLLLAIEKMQKEIENLGGKFLFEHKFINFCQKNNRIVSAIIKNSEKEFKIETDNILLCIGHSARQTFELLKEKNVNLEPKPFSVGLRIQHKQKDISYAQYGKFYDKLPPADYKLSHFLKDGRCVYTFCNCPGGYVVNASSECGAIVCNGMSYSARDGANSNSAILVSVDIKDFTEKGVLAGVNFQAKLEKHAFDVVGKQALPIQTFGDFIKDKVTTKLGDIKPMCKGETVFANLNQILPKFVCDAIKEGVKVFDKKIKGFARDDAILTGVETRSSSPIKIIRDENFETNIKGLYGVGEGAGYAGGIMSASVDGIKVALSISSKLQ